MWDKQIAATDPGSGAELGKGKFVRIKSDITIGDASNPKDPIVPDDEEDSGDYIIISNNDFDEDGLTGDPVRWNPISLLPLFGRYFPPLTDLDCDGVRPGDGEVRKMTITLYGPTGFTGNVTIASSSIYPNGDKCQDQLPLITVWWDDEGEWKQVSFWNASGGPAGIKVPITAGEQNALILYLEANEVPDFRRTDYNGQNNYFFLRNNPAVPPGVARGDSGADTEAVTDPGLTSRLPLATGNLARRGWRGKCVLLPAVFAARAEIRRSFFAVLIFHLPPGGKAVYFRR